MLLRPGVKVRFVVGEECLFKLAPMFEGAIRGAVLEHGVKTSIMQQLMVLCMGRFKSGLGIAEDIAGSFSGELAAGEKPSFRGECMINRINRRRDGGPDIRMSFSGPVEVTQEALDRFNGRMAGFTVEIIEPIPEIPHPPQEDQPDIDFTDARLSPGV